MTRAALLPTGSDPFLLAYWLRNFATWEQYVNELLIAVCGPLEDGPKDYIQSLVDAIPKASVYFIEKRTEHGVVIADLVSRTTATHVMLCEDDAFVRKPAVVQNSFSFAESGGIVGTPRESYASVEMISASVAAYGKSYAYWPCFLFIAREHLEATDKRFGGTRFDAGDNFLGKTLKQPALGDTMIWLSYQLHAMHLPERLIDNHRLSGQTVPDDAPWFHVGSLSGGHGGLFMSDISDDLYRHEIRMFGLLPNGNALQRVSWWWRVWERADDAAIPDYQERYAAGLSKVQTDLGIGWEAIEAHNRTIDPLITWAER